ncbi:MAG: glycosyltransferase family 4 protein [Treponemataceae bacterium]|nr:glycosyltransferase family 4 protein [Treponemataceae bacterium]
MKKICFLVYGTPRHPVGGTKVLFTYANMLVSAGNEVSILCYQKQSVHNSPSKNIRNLIKFLFKKSLRLEYPRWFPLNENCYVKYAWSISNEILKNFDVCVASSIETSYSLEKMKFSGKRFYLVQGFESWNPFTEQDVYESYKFPFIKIAISEWLYECIKKVDDKVVLIENGFDFEYFKLTSDIGNRQRYTVCMLNHVDSSKRCADVFRALSVLKEKYPLLKVFAFGVPPRPRNLPDWYEYYQCPNMELHNYVYNASSIFVNASEQEGWGLTVGEAMICGCAVVCTDNPGHRIMAHDNKTALVFAPRDVESIIGKISLLFEDDELRKQIAKNGNELIQKYTWCNAYKKFNDLIEYD